VILLTDGKNEHNTPEQLAEALSACEGRFTCDCRGVGTNWVVNELRTIASRCSAPWTSSPSRPASQPTSAR
jgi:hypothetical protein